MTDVGRTTDTDERRMAYVRRFSVNTDWE